MWTQNIFLQCFMAVIAAFLVKKLTNKLYWHFVRPYRQPEMGGIDTRPDINIGADIHFVEYIDLSDVPQEIQDEFEQWGRGLAMPIAGAVRVEINHKIMVDYSVWREFLIWKQEQLRAV